MADKIGALNFTIDDSKDAINIVSQGMDFARENKVNNVIIDTAGRLHIDEVLMEELKNIKNNFKPDEILLTVDGMTGQDAVNVSKSFNEALGITGVVLTKMDGETRGGAA